MGGGEGLREERHGRMGGGGGVHFVSVYHKQPAAHTTKERESESFVWQL